MINEDSIKLLKECNMGIKTGVISIDETLDKVKDEQLKKLLIESKESHEQLGNQTHVLLNDYHDSAKNPSVIVKAMSWMKINMKLAVEHSDQEIADVIFDGCNMGVKSLYKYLNHYKGAEEKVKELTKSVIKEEEKLRENLVKFL